MLSSRTQSSTVSPPATLTSIPERTPQQVAETGRLLNEAAIFTIFNTANPALPNTPVPSPTDPTKLIGMDVNEDLHRFDINVPSPGLNGFHATNRVGELVANIHIQWRVIPDDYVAFPNVQPPPTVLDPTRSQRFCMLGGQMTFKDPEGSYLHAFGTGRTFPVMVGNQPQLRIGAVVDILEGFGRLKGVAGTIVVNGYITPPYSLDLSIVIRLLDPGGRFRPHSSIPALKPIANPDPSTVFILLKGEPDPDNPITFNPAPDGTFQGVNLKEVLRLIYVDFDVARGMVTRYRLGPVVGRLSAVTHVNPFDGLNPSPITTTNGVLEFFDGAGNTFGTLQANIVEGRAFPAAVPGAISPFVRVGGFGPFISGSGQFDGVIGMMTVNSALSLDPPNVSMLYLLRISDPDRRFRKTWQRA